MSEISEFLSGTAATVEEEMEVTSECTHSHMSRSAKVPSVKL